MLPESPTIRRRGGQPGNQNAKGNRGNRNARGKLGNRGGRGAPHGNQFARKRWTLDAELLKEFRHCPEAMAWVQSNADKLRAFDMSDDSRLAFNVYLGLTPEALADSRQEFRFGLYYIPESQEGDFGEMAALE
jgi:hypothetical protein